MIEGLVKSTCDEFKKARQKFSRLAPQLDHIRFPEHDLSLPFGHLCQGQCNDWMNWSKHVVRYGEKIPRYHYRYYGIEQKKYGAPQKHSFWSYATAGAIYYVNCFCHGDRCKKKCNTLHERSYLLVANLLKILYPNIWREKADNIANNIKTRALRLLRS